MRNIILVCSIILLLVAGVFSQTSPEQLTELTAQLQKKPDDKELREKIINLALSMNPAPQLPEEATRRMARGEAAFESAKEIGDYNKAVAEFQAAANAAPWYADSYFNLGLTQEKALKAKKAMESFRFYLLAAPDAKDKDEIKKRLYKLEYAAEQQEASAKEDTRKADTEAIAKRFEGTWYRMVQSGTGPIKQSFQIFRDLSGKWHLTGMMATQEYAPDDPIWLDGTELKFIEVFKIPGVGSAGKIEYIAKVSEDGKYLTFKYNDLPITPQEDKVRTDWLGGKLNHRWCDEAWIKE